MKKRKQTKPNRRGRLRNFCAALPAAVFLLLSLLIAAAGIRIDAEFSEPLPTELFLSYREARSPRFYLYRFSDRAARVGEAEPVGDGFFAQRQTVFVPLDEIPDNLKNAFVAIEDKRFYSHHGVDWYRTAAAAANYLLGFSDHFGASTITQQLVKNVTGQSEVTPARKLREILFASELERELTKDEILELYLNVIPFSDGCNGVGEAARHFFSKKASELTLAECASVAAITNSPVYYHPVNHPDHNLSRRNLILSEMFTNGMIGTEEYESALAEPLRAAVDPEGSGEGINSWYADMVIEDVVNDLTEAYGMTRSAASGLVYSGGLRIDVAMDPEVQKTVEEYYRSAMLTPVNRAGEHAQSAMIVLDPKTGDVLGVAGAVGKKAGNRVQNFATQTTRPSGSAIKPVSVYAPALENGLINWASVYDDVPVDFVKDGSTPWPNNANRVFRGLTNIAYAVAHSTNTVAVRVLGDLGREESFRWAKEKFRLNSLVGEDCDTAPLALGQLNYGVTLRELTAAYTAFADGGVLHPWRSYYRVTDRDGKILLSRTDEGERILSEGNAAVMTKLLQGVVEKGTSSVITLAKDVECAGKTGTSGGDCDRWFIGYTPEFLCGVWCGYEYPEALEGRNLCTSAWNTVLTCLTAGKEGGEVSFRVPPSVVRASYCADSGKLTSDACRLDPRGEREEEGWFVLGTEPTQFCDTHILCLYDGENGIFHGNCPAENLHPVALVRAERHFPVPVTVTDAQYAYDGDPLTLEACGDPTKPYFAEALTDECGTSGVRYPFNRSCPVTHGILPDAPEPRKKTHNFFRRLIGWKA